MYEYCSALTIREPVRPVQDEQPYDVACYGSHIAWLSEQMKGPRVVQNVTLTTETFLVLACVLAVNE